ncbi:MAG: TetR/AcrR family transcriptional regulator, partial [Acidimicrobiia bacterium]
SASAGRSIARTRVFDSLGRLITAANATQLRAAGRDDRHAEPMAFAAMGMIFGATEWWLDRQTMTRAELVDLLTEILWSGLRGGKWA